MKIITDFVPVSFKAFFLAFVCGLFLPAAYAMNQGAGDGTFASDIAALQRSAGDKYMKFAVARQQTAPGYFARAKETFTRTQVRIQMTLAAIMAGVMTGYRSFRAQPAPMQLGEVILAGIVISNAWNSGLFGLGDKVRSSYNWLFPPERSEKWGQQGKEEHKKKPTKEDEARDALWVAMKAHYESVNPSVIPFAALLARAVPDGDLGIITSQFLILNLDQKLAAFLSQQVLSESDFFASQSEQYVFILEVMHYRSGNETITELKTEMDLRAAQPDQQQDTTRESGTISVENYCNNLRWQGTRCLVYLDEKSGVKVAKSKNTQGDIEYKTGKPNEELPKNAKWQSYDFYGVK